jgi:hypothetical protein
MIHSSTHRSAGVIMQVPGFLRKDPTQVPGLPEEEDGRSRGYGVQGCLLGAIVAVLLWFVPLPVAVVVWVLGLKGPFGDYMLMAIPFFISPGRSSWISSIVPRPRARSASRRQVHSKTSSPGMGGK